MRRLLLVLSALIVIFGIIPLMLVEKGDWLGPLERLGRAAFHGWDMWANEGVRPYERPMPRRVEGTVPFGGGRSYEAALRQADAMPAAEQLARGALVYGRFCRHCHGPNGDGRVIVGESFDVALPDLRGRALRRRSDEQLFHAVSDGGENMIPLAETVAAEDLVLAVRYLRTLKDAPSEPYYERK